MKTDAMIEKVARAICKGEGYDPDAVVMQGPLPQGPHGTFYFQPSVPPTSLWKSYQRQARAAIEALEQYDLKPSKFGWSVDPSGRPVLYSDWLRSVRNYAYDLLRPNLSDDNRDLALAGLRRCFQERVS